MFSSIIHIDYYEYMYQLGYTERDTRTIDIEMVSVDLDVTMVVKCIISRIHLQAFGG